MAERTKFYELFDGEVILSEESSGCITIKAVTSYGDPVELGEDEALELANKLLAIVKNMRE